jgi:hypothetical protein
MYWVTEVLLIDSGQNLPKHSLKLSAFKMEIWARCTPLKENGSFEGSGYSPFHK